ncbi:MAG: PIN domain-containing protein [Verrucomicrobiota bacterium]|nr:PIN domain-containing protein [Verrucomicrobiota bacterium]
MGRSSLRCFTDTSFLCALFREQDNSAEADELMATGLTGNVVVSSLVLWEFRQSARFQVYRHSKDRTKGFSKREADHMISALAKNLDARGLLLESVEWPDVHSLAESLSAKNTMTGGHRPMDILHLATVKHLRLTHFLTFDANQKKLVEAEGLVVLL